DTVGKYETAIKEYIKNQLQEDIANDQLSLKEFIDPFTGEKSAQA
ncbi:MAG: IS200/IS605 family transposase, partial [Oscillospiraceae bacterium]